MVRTPLSLVMPTLDWGATFRLCLEQALACLQEGDEALVVLDGDAAPAPPWLEALPVRLLSTGRRSGPAAARNLGAQQAAHPILMFVDADVALHADALARIRTHFAADPQLAAVFGSYDDHPAAPGLVSQFRNLLHHHTHSRHGGEASTFWAGCGAVRRQPFLALGGFDAAAYGVPSIEDIEFGLRLSDGGARIRLDPAIQATHHKRWTLGSMVRTDILQRALPWSRLLLHRRQPSTRLNLDGAARLSSVLSLTMAVLLAAMALGPGPGPTAALGLTLGLVLLLSGLINRRFYGLCWRRGGPALALAAVGLHNLYFLYSLVCFLLVMAQQAAQEGPSPRARRLALLGLLGLLALYAGYVLGGGLLASLHHSGADLLVRAREYAAFQRGIYPLAGLAEGPQAGDVPTTVYPPYAVLLFGLFFGLGGPAQAWPMVQGLSLISLGLISWIGWRSLRFAGPGAAWLGALAPLAISGNGNCLFHGQFSILCMGLVALEGLLLQRRRPLAAGLCWALAMLKPQIGLAFALPLLGRGNRRGLALGVALLVLLSALCLALTRLSPLRYLAVWGEPGLLQFTRRGSVSLMGLVGPAALALVLGIGLGLGLLLSRGRARAAARLERPLRSGNGSAPDPMGWLRLQGLAAVLGALGFYHLNYDNIMLYPALLAMLVLALRHPGCWTRGLATALALSLWFPVHLSADRAGPQALIALTWLLAGLTLLLHRPAFAPPGKPASAV